MTSDDATNKTTKTTTTTTTPSESDVYDRQIRLWGAESQAKMQQSKVLYIHVTGVTAEVLKNLVLAGIAATLCDPRPTHHLETSPHFFSSTASFPTSALENNNNTTNNNNNNNNNKKLKYASVAHSVKPLVEELNPLLGACPVLEKVVEELTADDLKPYTIIMASQLPLEQAVRLSELASQQKIKFYVGDCFGMNGVAMMDLGPKAEYRPEQGKQLLDPIPLYNTAKKSPYVPLSQAVQVPLGDCTNRFHKTPPTVWVQYRCLLEYHSKTNGEWLTGGDDEKALDPIILQDFLKAQKAEDSLSLEDLTTLGRAGMAQVAPVCAVLGGMLGNEIIKVISGKGEPANNTLLLDGTLCKAWTFLVQPKK